MAKTSPKPRSKPKPSLHQQRMGKWLKILLVLVVIVFAAAFYLIARMSNRVGSGIH